MSVKPILVPLSRIHLDLDNPRHATLSSEFDVIQHLLAQEDIRPLAKHIAEAGRTSPLELTALIPHAKIRDGFTTAEGNRRLCALKLLADPDKAAKDVDRRYFRKLQQDIGTPLKNVLAIVFDSKDEARPWIELRHEGPQGGIGTKPWKPEQKTRFNQQGKGDNPNALGLAIIDYARNRCLLAQDELDALTLTTLTRFLSTPDVRSALGLSSNKALEINVPTDEFERAVRQFLRDSITPDNTVNSRANASDRKAYAENLRSSGVAPTTRGLPRSAPSSQTPAAPATRATVTTTQRDNRHPDKRRYVIPSDFGARIRDKTLKRLYDELKTLPAHDFGFCAVYLLRTVIEKSAVLYLKSHRISPKNELHEKLGQLADRLEKDGMTARELKFLRTVARNGKDDPHSPDTLGHYVHGGAVPQKTYVTRYWDNIEPVMQRVLNIV